MHWLNGSIFAPFIQCGVMNHVVVHILFLYYDKVLFECMELGAGVRVVVSLERAQQPYFLGWHEIYWEIEVLATSHFV